MTNKQFNMVIARLIRLEDQVKELQEERSRRLPTGADDRRVPAVAGGSAPDTGGWASIGEGGDHENVKTQG